MEIHPTMKKLKVYKVHKNIDWPTVFLGIIALVMLLNLSKDFALVAVLSKKLSPETEYRRGYVEARSRAYQFIRSRDKLMGLDYYKWLKKKGVK